METQSTSSQPNSWNDLWRTEDYWAIWIGFLLILAGALLYLPNPPENLHEQIAEANRQLEIESQKAPFRTLAWYEARDRKAQLKATSQATAKTIKRWTGKPHTWTEDPRSAFILSESEADEKNRSAQRSYETLHATTEALKNQAQFAQQAAARAAYENPKLNAAAEKSILEFREQHRIDRLKKKQTRLKPYNQLLYFPGLGLFMGLCFALGMQVMRKEGWVFLKGFALVYLLAILAFFFSAQTDIKTLGIGYAAWAILIGLLISNTLGTPQWLRPAIQVEFFIKTGLVLLGAEILFGKVLLIGLPGLFIAWVVTPIVLCLSFWFGQRVLKMASKTLNITICADMSVCGVSAAIATAAACRAKKEELTLAIGLSLAFTSIMMIVMPNVIRSLGMDHVLGGAWLGGTLDATGAVAAAGAFLSDRALYVATTIKMIQNILIGVISFAVALYWVSRVEVDGQRTKPSLGEIWIRFPKFVIGFVLASIAMSSLYQWMGPDAGEAMLTHGVIKGWTKIWRGWFFCLAFVSIGLATNFRELAQYFRGGKPLILYVCGQTLNLALTLGMAYLMFFIVFPEITAKL